MAASEPATTTGTKIADGALYPHNCILYSLMLETDGVNAASAIIYDNPSAASGNIVASISCTGVDRYQMWSLDCGVEAASGLYLDITGTGAKIVAHYRALSG